MQGCMSLLVTKQTCLAGATKAQLFAGYAVENAAFLPAGSCINKRRDLSASNRPIRGTWRKSESAPNASSRAAAPAGNFRGARSDLSGDCGAPAGSSAEQWPTISIACRKSCIPLSSGIPASLRNRISQQAGSPPCFDSDPERHTLFKISMMHQRDWSTAGKKKIHHGFAVRTVTTSAGTDRA
jgi:hypothetical protein